MNENKNIQKVATEMSKLVENLEENFTVLQKQKNLLQVRPRSASPATNRSPSVNIGTGATSKLRTNIQKKKAAQQGSSTSNTSKTNGFYQHKHHKHRRSTRSTPTLRKSKHNTQRPSSESNSSSHSTKLNSRSKLIKRNNEKKIILSNASHSSNGSSKSNTASGSKKTFITKTNKNSAILRPLSPEKSILHRPQLPKASEKGSINSAASNNIRVSNQAVFISNMDKKDNTIIKPLINSTMSCQKPAPFNKPKIVSAPYIVPYKVIKHTPPERVQLLPTKTDITLYNTYPKYMTDLELLAILKKTVEKAIRERKTFSVCGNYYTIRRALLQRGWVEKIRLSYNTPDKNNLRALEAKTINELLPLVNSKQNGQNVRNMIMSKLLAKHQVDFYWDHSYDAYKVNPDNVKYTLINNIRRGMLSYASKQGLCEAMKRAHWYQKPGVSYMRHPRSYSLTNNGDPDQFIGDFKITSAMSLLKWVVMTSEANVPKLISPQGKVPMTTFHFALNECNKFVKKCKHEDIDDPIEEAPDFQWNEFLENYYKIVHIGSHFSSTHLENEETLVHKSKLMMKKLRRFWPHLDMDGVMNIWILKPVNGSRGIGIHICRTLQYVLKVITENKNLRYVIQKYIERPLLIYNTKFDIRQWFLISSTMPLTIWMYKQCYLRFSSQTYNLRKLHESIHLTNNSVQVRYKNCNRDPSLPEHNMWDSNQFQKYLEMIGYPNAFKTTVYPGMRQCIVAAVLVNQEYVAPRRNSFELYGADFMLTEDFKPWLIEINSRPALYASTPVTAQLCPQVLEDVIKVVVDYAENCCASTGSFQLIFRQGISRFHKCDPSELSLEGKAIPWCGGDN